MKKRILVIGSLNVDAVIEMKKMPQVGETILGSKVTYIPGGKGANQVCTVARLGDNGKILGCIGQDHFGKMQENSLLHSGVDISTIKKSDSAATGMASIYVDEEGNNSIVVVPGANAECDVNYIGELDKVIQESDYIILQMEIPIASITYAIERAKELNKIVILNPAPAPDHISGELLEKIDYITPNETELMRLCGKRGNAVEDYRNCAKELLQKGVKNVLVTLGNQGALLVNAGMEKIFPARKVLAVDTTAAGDCFNGAFVVALSEGKDVEEAIIFANAASSIAVTRNGAQTSIPTRQETDEIFEQMMSVKK
ncbi:MAG: ribokinase [Lachnospiraceae bacterium]|nr:ribokinase [Lachnospiraceae bacterium]